MRNTTSNITVAVHLHLQCVSGFSHLEFWTSAAYMVGRISQQLVFVRKSLEQTNLVFSIKQRKSCGTSEADQQQDTQCK